MSFGTPTKDWWNYFFLRIDAHKIIGLWVLSCRRVFLEFQKLVLHFELSLDIYLGSRLCKLTYSCMTQRMKLCTRRHITPRRIMSPSSTFMVNLILCTIVTFFMSCLHYTEQSINRLLDIWGLCYVRNRDEEVIWSNPIPGRQLHRHLIICLQI